MKLETFYFMKRLPYITGAPPAKNVIIYLSRFNVRGRPGLDNGALLRLVLPLGGFLNMLLLASLP